MDTSFNESTAATDDEIRSLTTKAFQTDCYKELIDINYRVNAMHETQLRKCNSETIKDREVTLRRQLKDIQLLYSVCDDRRKILSDKEQRTNHNFRHLSQNFLDPQLYDRLRKASKMRFKEGLKFLKDQ